MAKQQAKGNGTGAASGTEAVKEQDPRAAQGAKERYTEARRQLDEAIDRLESRPAVQNVQSATAQVRRWVEDNPALAVLLAAGGGMLLGKLLAALFRIPEPSFTRRTRDRTMVLADQARRYAGEAGEQIARRSADVRRQAEARSADIEGRITRGARALGEETSRHTRQWRDRAARQASEAGRHVSDWGRRASEQAVHLGERAGHQFDEASHALRQQAARLGTEAAVVGEEAARRARATGESVSEQARAAAARAEETAHRLAKRVRPQPPTFGERVVQALKTLLTAEALRRLLKRLRVG